VIQFARALALAIAGLCILAAPSLAATGDLDPTFSNDGKVTPFYAIDDIALQPDGKIVYAGPDDVERLNPNGSPDEGFQTHGLFQYSPNAVAIQSDGKIVLAGFDLSTPGDADFAVVRLQEDGSLDTSFSGDGVAETDFGGHDDLGRALALRSDGGIVVAGTSDQLSQDDVPSRDFAVAQYLPDGTLDSSFSGDGKRTLDIGSDELKAVAVDPSDRIAVAGAASHDFTLVRFEPEGSLDSGFSGDGKAFVEFPHASEALGLTLQDDGRLVATGLAVRELGSKLAVARFDDDGTLDQSFSGDGKASTDQADAGEDVAIQPDGGIVVAGQSARGSYDRDFAVARYLPDGSLDPSFSSDGVATTRFSLRAEASSLALQPDGRIIVGGNLTYCDKFGCEPFGGLARLLVDEGPPDADADGVLDPDDACPALFNPDNPRGCPVYEDATASLSYRTETHRFAGKYRSVNACEFGQTGKVFHERSGVVHFFGSGITHDAGVFHVDGRHAHGWYFARVRKHLDPDVGICRGAESDPIWVD
jgi:uncharacterized delta-60 repeat protein